MSSLIKETEDEIFLVQIISYEPSEYSDWQCSPNGKECPDPNRDEKLINTAEFALYGIEIKYKINKKTYQVTILEAS